MLALSQLFPQVEGSAPSSCCDAGFVTSVCAVAARLDRGVSCAYLIRILTFVLSLFSSFLWFPPLSFSRIDS